MAFTFHHESLACCEIQNGTPFELFMGFVPVSAKVVVRERIVSVRVLKHFLEGNLSTIANLVWKQTKVDRTLV